MVEQYQEVSRLDRQIRVLRIYTIQNITFQTFLESCDLSDSVSVEYCVVYGLINSKSMFNRFHTQLSFRSLSSPPSLFQSTQPLTRPQQPQNECRCVIHFRQLFTSYHTYNSIF